MKAPLQHNNKENVATPPSSKTCTTMTSFVTSHETRPTVPQTMEETTQIPKMLAADPEAFPPISLPGFITNIFFERGRGLLKGHNTMTVMLSENTEYANGVSVKESEKHGKKLLSLFDGSGNEVALVAQESETTYKILGNEPLNEGDKPEEHGCYPWYLFTLDKNTKTAYSKTRLAHEDLKVWTGSDFVSSVPRNIGKEVVQGFFPEKKHMNLANTGKEQLVFAIQERTVQTDSRKKEDVPKAVTFWEISMAPTADVALILCLAAVMEVSQ